MDELAARLKRDAAQIQAEPSPELQVRLDVSLRAVHTLGPITDDHSALYATRDSMTRNASWLLSGLTGLAAVGLLILLVNWNSPVQPIGPGDQARAVVVSPGPDDAGSRLPEDWYVPDNFSLKLRPADLTHSLDEELINLRSDLEKARDSVERDVKFAF